MRWPWRPEREASPAPPTDADLAEQVDEGLLIVLSGLRLSARNRIVLDTLRDRTGYDEDALVAGVRTDAAEVVAEQRTAIERLRRIRVRAASRRGQAMHSADYRRGDVAPLERRERIADLLVARLEETVADDTFVIDLVHAARRASMEDMFDSALRSLHDSPTVADEGRADRIAALHEQLQTLTLDPDDD